MGKCQSSPGNFEAPNKALILSIESQIPPKKIMDSPIKPSNKENLEHNNRREKRSATIQEVEASKDIFSKKMKSSMLAENDNNVQYSYRDKVTSKRESRAMSCRSRSHSSISASKGGTNRNAKPDVRNSQIPSERFCRSSRQSRVDSDSQYVTMNNSFEGASLHFENEIKCPNYNPFNPKRVIQSPVLSNPKKLPMHIVSKKFGLHQEFFRGYFNQLPSNIKEIIDSLGPFDYDSNCDDFVDSEYFGPVHYGESVYFGQLLCGLREGRGFMIWADGIVYEGFWKDDSTHGKGRLTNGTGEFYEGEFLNDKAHGYGTFWCPDSTYHGYWFADLPHGKGREEYSDGSKYEGEYSRGNKHGQGVFNFADGSVYKGGFFENFLNGRGIYKWVDGRVYDGCWSFNKMQGKGTFSWPDGRKYSGEYLSDKKHGYGVYEWPEGRRYEGYWKNGKQNGEGEMHMPDGNILKGKWVNGKFHNE